MKIKIEPGTVEARYPIYEFFNYEHLPEKLQVWSIPFSLLATKIIMSESLSGPEVSAGLRKLLEAKDCIVRAAAKEWE